MNLFFKFDKGKYATRSKHLQHDWYLTQVEVCSNVIFKSARFCTSLFERLLDKFARVGLPDTIAKIFSLRPARTDSKSFATAIADRLVYNSEILIMEGDSYRKK
jgi:hypothetical protein